MKLVAPIGKAYEVGDIIQAGADELYCGVYTNQWRNRYTDIAAPNRHPGKSANLKDFKELNRVVKLAHTDNIPVFFTINEFYSGGQYCSALYDVEAAIDAGVDALIVVDINLLLMIKEKNHNIKLHMGTGGTSFNSETVAFYKNLGVSRVILDRQLTIEEIGLISSKSSNVELETFVLNQKCHNIDGFCTFQHGLIATEYPLLSKFWNWRLTKRIVNLFPYGSSRIEANIFRRELGCCLNYKFYNSGAEFDSKKIELRRFFDAGDFLNRCGACALYDLNKLRVGFAKVVGREDPTVKKIRDIKFIRNTIDLLKNSLERQVFFEKVKELYADIYSSDCKEQLCYY